MRPYLSVVWMWTVTSLPNARSYVNCLARVPKTCFFTGESIPWRWTSKAFPPRITMMVSPSDTPTTFPVKVSLATTVLTQVIWKSAA